MSQLAEKIQSGQFVVTGELTPPKGTDVSEMRSRATALAPHIDAFNVTDSHASRMSLSPLASAHLLQDESIVLSEQGHR